VTKAFGKDAEHFLVFHGGSGSELSEIHETLGYGVIKMNIDTDTQYAYTRPVVDFMLKNYDKVLKVDGEVGSKKTLRSSRVDEVSRKNDDRKNCHCM
jgi:fructose-bisphosphate aldolase class II